MQTKGTIEMRKSVACLFAALAVYPFWVTMGHADEDGEGRDTPLQYELELEVGVENTYRADDPAEVLSDMFLSIEGEIEYAASDRITQFTELVFESVLDVQADRAFDDLGVYVGELGVRVDADPVTLSFGKFSPAFGSAWDSAPGYFGTAFAEDYELEEMLGLSVAIGIGPGVLTASAFYADDSRLSDSFGTRRGRTIRADGGPANTGKLNNFALQYDVDLDGTSLHAGVRHLTKGQGDTRDERGIAVGLTHDFAGGIGVIAELAHFKGWDGTTASADHATLGASLTRGPFKWSLVHSIRDVSGAPTDHMTTFGLDYTFPSGVTLSASVMETREEGEASETFGMSVVIPFGG